MKRFSQRLMRIPRMRRTACRVCQATRFHWLPDATTAVGLPDLDSRPGGPARQAILKRIRRCRSCGYCAPVLSDGDDVVVRVVRSPEYQRVHRIPTFPRLAQKWMCWSTIQEESDEFSAAGWSSLRAAWVCDDRLLPVPAKSARDRSIRLFERARDVSQSFGSAAASEAALLADLLRRSGNFENAAEVAGSATPDDGTLATILAAQRLWSVRRDAGCYTLTDAVRDVAQSTCGSEYARTNGRAAGASQREPAGVNNLSGTHT